MGWFLLGSRHRREDHEADQTIGTYRAAPIVALALMASGCSTLGNSQTDAAALPPAPPVIELTDPLQFLTTDGLHRLVVTPPPPSDRTNPSASDPVGSDPTPASGRETADDRETTKADSTSTNGEPTADLGTGTPETFAKIDPLKLSQMTGDTEIVFQGPTPGYLDADGRFVSLAADAAQTEKEADQAVEQSAEQEEADTDTSAKARTDGTNAVSDATQPQPGEHPAITELRTLAAVVSVVAIGDGSYAVTSSDSDIVDQLDPELRSALSIAPDAPLALSNDPYEPYQWALDNTGTNLATVQSPSPAQLPDADIDGAEAAAGPTGAGVVVAVIDTGVDTSHPDLATQMWRNPGETCGNGIDDDGNGYVDDCDGWDFGYEDNIPWAAGNGNHGTHVAGIIAAANNGEGIVGVAPAAKIMNLSVAGPGGLSTSSIARAIRYAVDNGAHVINMSLGSSPGTPAYAVAPMISAVEYAEAAGVVVVVAAGNSNVNLSTSPVYPANIDTNNMVVVGASDPDETKASYSNYGPVVTLFAPGSLILSAVPGGYSFLSGTSMASPIVAGIAATVLEANPDADPPTVRNQLVGTADEIGVYTSISSSGTRLNAARAVGINPDAVEADVTISGLAAATPESVSAEISLDGGDLIDLPYRWEASLVAIMSDGAYGIIDHPVTIDGQAAATDQRGAVLLSEMDAESITLETALPDGTYGLMVEAVSLTDPDARIGQAFVATFDVGQPAGPDTDEGGQPTTSAPAATTSTTAAQATTTTTNQAPNPSTTTSQTTTPSSTPTTTIAGQPTSTTAAPTTPTTTPAGSNSTVPTTVGQTTTAPPTPTTGATTSTTTGSGGGGHPGGGGGQTTTTAVTSLPTTVTSTTMSPTTVSSTTVPPTTLPAATSTTTPSTTAAPSTSTIQPTTTAAATPTTTAPAPSPTVADPTGQWFVDRIVPNLGPISSKSTVSITGHFPQDAYVWFGSQPGEIIYQTSTWILARTPTVASPGSVDVQVRKGSIDLVVPGGFVFYDPTPGASTTTVGAAPTTTQTTSPAGGGTTSTTSGGAATSSTQSGGDGLTTTTIAEGTTTTTAAPGATSTTDGQTTTTTAAVTTTTVGPPVPPAPRPIVTGEPISLGGEVQGVPIRGIALTGVPSLQDIPRCASDPCRIRRI